MKSLMALFALLSCSVEEGQAIPRVKESELEGLLALLMTSGAGIDKSIRVTTVLSDLNNDGVSEVIAYIKGDSMCGSGGCTLFILRAKATGYEAISKLTVTRPPVRILESKSNGWQDIAVRVGGGGISAGYEARLRFDGQSYPSNPSLIPLEKGRPRSGHIVIDLLTPATELYD
jgi:hypothetical protein